MSPDENIILQRELIKEKAARQKAEQLLAAQSEQLLSLLNSRKNINGATPYSKANESLLEDVELNKRLIKALGKIGDNIWEHNFQTGITRFSKQIEVLLGFKNVSAKEIDNLWWSRIHSDDVAMLLENDVKIRKGEIDSQVLEYRMLHNDGSIIWIQDKGVVVERNEQGAPLLMIGTHTNITKFKKTEAELQKSEKRWKFALEGAGDGVWEYNYATGVSFYSKKYRQILGFDDEIYSTDKNGWMSFIHPDDLPAIEASENEYLRNRKSSHSREYRVKHKDGHYIWVLDRGMITEVSPTGVPILITGTYTVIDEAKKLQIELTATANRLLSLITNLQLGVLVEDCNCKLVTTNRWFCDLFKIKADPESLVGTDGELLANTIKHQFLKEDAFIKSRNSCIKANTTKLRVNFKLKDNRILTRDFIPIKDNEGNNLGFMSVYYDVSETVNASQKLEEQRLFYENILNNLPADIVVFDKDHRYQYLNPVAMRNNDLRQWIIGKTDEEYFTYTNKPLQNLALRKAHWDNALQQKKIVSWEEDTTDVNGNPRTNLRNLYPIYDNQGALIQVLGYGIEITERKTIERAIINSEKRYRDLIQFSIGLIVTHDMDGNFLSINPAVEELIGIKAEWIIGKNILKLLPEKSRNSFIANYLPDLKQYGKAEGVFKYWNKQGDPLYLMFKNVMVNEDGKKPYVIAFAQDITDRVIAQKELELAKKTTDESAAAKAQFLANMSHEIRTPMNGIIGISRLLNKTPLNDEQQSFLNMILGSAEQMLIIINDILDLEKINAGKITFEQIDFSIDEKINQIIELFRFKAKEKHLELKVINEIGSNCWLKGDPYRLAQIVNNLVSNALKFTDRGGIYVTIKKGDIQNDQQLITISVKDTGIGIDNEKMNDIFNPYVQEKSDTSRKYGGTGLGLAITKNLIELQGGTIAVSSTTGEGSTFSFTLGFKPADEQSLHAKERVTMDVSKLAGISILVAEDVSINQFLVRYILNSWGVNPTIVNNGVEVLEMLKHHMYDVILMDIQMPVMDGMHTTQVIRELEDKEKSSIPIIALTANALRDDDKKYKKAGMNGYLSKPFTEEGLYKAIEQVLFQENKIQITENIHKSTIIAKQLNLIDMVYNLDMLREMGGGDESFLTMMVQLFIDTVPEILIQMQVALKEEKWVELGGLAHKVKPTIDSMGITSLKELIREVEKEGKSATNTAGLSAKVHTVITTLQQCIDEMKNDFKL